MILVESLIQDLRYGLRLLLKDRSFALTVIITLGLGIGLNSALFSIADGALLRDPPGRDPDRLLVLTLVNPSTGSEQNLSSAAEFSALRERGYAFEGIAAASYQDVAMTEQGETELITTARITPNYFELFGIQPAIGRAFTSREDAVKQQTTAVISYDLWQTRFSGDTHIIGSSVVLGAQNYQITGVMPPQFKYAFSPCDAWIAASFVAESLTAHERGVRNMYVVGRLKDGISVQQAQAESRATLQQLTKEEPSERDWVARLRRLKDIQIEPSTRVAILSLTVVVGFVLLVACANVAGMSIARDAARQNELAIRTALGAERRQLVQQLLCESAPLALVSGAFGILISLWGVRLLRSEMAFEPPMALLASRIGVNSAVLLFTFLVSLLTLLVFGLMPAIQISNPDLHESLNESGHAAPGGLRPSRLQSAIVVGQVAIVTVLLTCTGAAIQLVMGEIRARLGFNPREILTVDLTLSGPKYADATRQAAFFTEAINQMRQLQEVQIVAAVQPLPESNATRIPFEVEGQTAQRREQRPQAGKYIVSSDYFRAMEILLLEGRSFSPYDTSQSPKVAIVNETFAKRFFPSAKPVGAHILTYSGIGNVPDTSMIVGVVKDVIDRVGQTADMPQLYVPFLQNPVSSMTVVLRSRDDKSTLASAVRSSIWAMDKNQPIGRIETMREVLARKGAGDRLLSALLGIFTGLALSLATMGIYGVVSYIVVKRTHEIGVRMALGAHGTDVFWLIVRKGLFLAASGMACGLLPALACLRFLAHPITADAWVRSSLLLVASLVLVIVAAILACYLPAHRATRMDPTVALRHE